MKLELSNDQVWLVTRGLLWLTSQQGEAAICAEYPSADFEAITEDVGKVLAQMETSVSSGETSKNE